MDFVNALSQFKPWQPSIVPEDTKFRKSAILVPLQLVNGKLRVIMTVRSRNLSRYSGDVAFPGGMQDPADDGDFVKTALREAEEEIGLRPEKVRVLCQLRPCVTQHGIVVVPVVGLVQDDSFVPVINREEVEECFTVDWNDISRLHVSWKPTRVMKMIPYNIMDICIDSRRIWGVTANVLLLLLLMDPKRRLDFLDVPLTYLDIELIPSSVNLVNKL